MANILIIDDDEIILNVLSRALQERGHTVRVTADGPNGISIYQDGRFNLVLLDLGLPSMSGTDVLKEIKRLDANARVVIMSGYLCAKNIADTVHLGALAFLEKGFSLDHFEDTIESVLTPFRAT
jgi:DNA-binding NtrC family response regulator